MLAYKLLCIKSRCERKIEERVPTNKTFALFVLGKSRRHERKI